MKSSKRRGSDAGVIMKDAVPSLSVRRPIAVAREAMISSTDVTGGELSLDFVKKRKRDRNRIKQD